MATAIQVTLLQNGLKDSSNRPASGGFAVFYETDGTTPKSVYSDNAKTAATLTLFQVNNVDTYGVKLNNLGQAKIFGEGTYTIKGYNKDGVLIDSWVGNQFTPFNPATNIVEASLYTSVSDAITAAGGSDTTIYFAPGNYAINANVTIPSTVNIRMEQGAYFTIATGITLTVNAVIDAPLYNIFRGSGTVTIASKNNNIPSIWLQTAVDGNRQLKGVTTIDTADITTFKLGSTQITSTAAELNILDGVTSTKDELNILDGVTATKDELNILDGVTATKDEINLLDGVTSTTAELNILDGVTATKDEINILDGVTADKDEINKLDGLTKSTDELNTDDPAGCVAAFARTSVPTGWLECNGQNVNRTTYTTLFAAIGVTWGVGNGTTTFTLPDFRDRYPRGKSTSHAVGAYLDELTKLPTTSFTGASSEEGDHEHDSGAHFYHSDRNNLTYGYTSSSKTRYYADSHANRSSTSDYGADTSVNGDHTHTTTITGGGDAETRPKTSVVLYCIKI